MAGMMVCTWPEESTDSARVNFQRVCDAWTSRTGLTVDLRLEGATWALVRFALPKSRTATPIQRVLHVTRGHHVVAGAGWWLLDQDPERELTQLEAEDLQSGSLPLRLDGQFMMCQLDTAGGTAKVFGDGTGLFPIYTAELGDAAWATSDPMALASAFHCPLHPVAIRCVFAGDSVRAPYSAFDGIRKLDLGESVSLSGSRGRVGTTWDPFSIRPSKEGLSDLIQQGLASMDRAGTRLRRLYPSIQADLTGGFDSRMMAAMINRPGLPPVHHNVVGPESNPDVRIARLIPQKLNWPLTVRQHPADWGMRRVEVEQQAAVFGCGEIRLDALDGPLTIRKSEEGRYDGWTTGAAGEQFRDFF